jgi:hypothetical protein
MLHQAIRISNLIGKGFPCHGNRCRFDADLIRVSMFRAQTSFV